MNRFWSVRNSLLAICVLGTVTLLWLTTLFWLDARDQRADSLRISDSTEIGDLLLASAREFAAERVLTHAALNAKDEIALADHEIIMAHRRRADDALTRARNRIRETVEFARSATALEDTERRISGIDDLRARVDLDLRRRYEAREATPLKLWFGAVTEMIMAVERLHLGSQYQAKTAARNIEALQRLNNAVWVMSEYAERETAIIAGTIAAEDPLVLNDVEKLSAYRGHLERAWTVFDGYARLGGDVTDARIVAAIDHVRRGYFETFGRIRAPIIQAGMEGDEYPVDTVEWLAQSGAAIAPIRDLGKVVTSNLATLARESERDGVRGLIVATLVLIGALIMAAGSTWIIVGWIVGPLDKISKAMVAVAAGDETVPVPFTTHHNEIGDMARAVQAFRDSAENKARQIAEANVELQSLNAQLTSFNETLEERVTQRTMEVATARDDAIEANQAKSVFLATMSHELRTPLNSVLGMAGFALDSDLTEEQRDYIETIRSSGQDLLEIIDDILDLSNLEAKRVELEVEDFDLVALIEGLTPMVASRVRAKDLELRTSVPPDTARFVRGDSDRLRQIMLNLLSNAVKFTDSGTISIDASTALRDGDEVLLRFSVTDTGIGIAEDKLAKLFSKFTQADDSTTRKYGGTGLGLTIAQQLCERMGGEIGVDSEPGQGSTFWFTARLGRSDRSAIRAPPRKTASVTGDADGEDTARRPRDRLRVLLAEDNLANQKIATLMLLKAGHDVDVAANGLEAVDAVRRLDYDLVLMDINMPEMDGVAATREIRVLPGAKGQVPIIAVTANAIKGDRERYLGAGMNDYVSKPIDERKLDAAIARQCGVDLAAGAAVAAAETAEDAPRSAETEAEVADLLATLDDIAL